MNLKLHLLLAVFILGIFTQITFDKSSADQDFVNRAMLFSRFEIESAIYAKSRLNEMDVKKYCNALIHYNDETLDDLENFAHSQKWIVEKNLDVVHMRILDSIKNIPNQSFDQSFVQLLIDRHEQTIALFAEWLISEKISDIALKEMISMRLPSLRAHLEKAKELAVVVNN